MLPSLSVTISEPPASCRDLQPLSSNRLLLCFGQTRTNFSARSAHGEAWPLQCGTFPPSLGVCVYVCVYVRVCARVSLHRLSLYFYVGDCGTSPLLRSFGWATQTFQAVQYIICAHSKSTRFVVIYFIFLNFVYFFARQQGLDSGQRVMQRHLKRNPVQLRDRMFPL